LGEINEQQLLSGDYPYARTGDLIGKYGVEGNWQNHLTGVSGGRQVEVDAAGRKLKVISKRQPVPGFNLGLTIDRRLQLLADKSLSGKKGAIVAMNPNTGEILAMASSPAFDPNLFIKGMDQPLWRRLVSSKDYPLQNRAISGQYPPGSTFKIIVALAALEEGIITPEEEIFCPGGYQVGNRYYRCWRKYGHGKVNLHRALVESCDTYFYKVGRELGIDRIFSNARMCGLGIRTGIDLAYEKPGLTPSSQWKMEKRHEPWQQGETVTVAIGQSYTLVTPVQMASMISAIFNGGNLYKPKIVNWVGKGEKKRSKFIPTQIGKIKYEEEHISLIKNALIGVVNESQGTGGRARHPKVLVAGKTGTAQVITLDAEKELGEEEEIPVQFRDHAWFIAIAPADKPQLALAILIENGGHGGSAAAPIAGELFKFYFGKDYPNRS
jgi:penicillin-binding protein 2